MDNDVNLTLEDIKNLPNEEFKNLAEKYNVQIKGGLNSTLKNVKSKKIFNLIKENCTNTKLQTPQISLTSCDSESKNEYTFEYLSQLDNEKLKTLFTEYDIHVKGALNPAIKNVKIKNLLKKIQNKQITENKENISTHIPIIETLQPTITLNKESKQFYAIRPSTIQKDTNPDKFIFNDRILALTEFKKLKDKQASLSTKLSSYNQAIKWFNDEEVEILIDSKNLSSQISIISSPLRRKQSSQLCPVKPAREQKLNHSPKVSERDHNIIASFVKNDDALGLEKFITENPNRIMKIESCGPFIIKPALSWNVFHLAANLGSLNVIKLYVKLLTSLDFVKNLFENDENCLKCGLNLLKYYLNDRDKRWNDTPLHIASKFNKSHIISYFIEECHLSNYQIYKSFDDENLPLIDTNLLNNEGQTAEEVLGQRYTGILNEKAKTAVLNIFQNCYILRLDFDNQITIERYNKNNTPATYFGPSSWSFLNNILKILKSKNALNLEDLNKNSNSINFHSNLQKRRNILLSDYEKGLCKFLRKFSYEKDVTFYEYWPFLNKSISWQVNLKRERSHVSVDKEIFKQLEQHLVNKQQEIESSDEEFYSAPSSPLKMIDQFGDEDQGDTIDDLSKAFSKIDLKLNTPERQNSFKKPKILKNSKPKLYLETTDKPSKTDLQFYDAINQFYVDDEDLKCKLDKYPFFKCWYLHVDKLFKDDNCKSQLRTAKRMNKRR